MQNGVNLAEKNGNWLGDKVGYSGVHSWVKRRLSKPLICECCHAKKPCDLSNRSGEYKRDLGDWEWLCRTCHMIKDGRMDKLHKNNVGRKHSEEFKRKLGLKSKGHIVSAETRKKISIANTGHPVSLRVRKIISKCQRERQRIIRLSMI